MILIKLGGSVITDKSKEYTFREEEVKRLVLEIKEYLQGDADNKIILVHGGGSFGHPGAQRYGLNTAKPHDVAKGTAEVQHQMRRLNQMVMNIMLENGIWGVSIPGGLVSTFNNGTLEGLKTELFEALLDIGTTPVTYGDVAMDRSRVVTICSGDDLMMGLAPLAERAIFVTDVDGIIKDGDVVETFTEDMLPLSTHVHEEKKKKIDVTGGMNGKLKNMFEMSSMCQTLVINGRIDGRLKKALRGENVICTEVRR